MRFSVLVIFTAVILKCHSAEIGDSCEIGVNRIVGKCLFLQNCSKAIEEVQQRQRLPQICGFQESQVIVCCENTISNNTTTTASPNKNENVGVGSISRQKCREYGQYVYGEIRHPVDLLDETQSIKVDKCALNLLSLIGENKARPREFPHMALIGFNSESGKIWLCAGVLISERFVLSVAHCANHSVYGKAKYVLLGDLNIERTDDDTKTQEFDIEKIIVHPNFVARRVYNDIALIKLNRSATLDSYVRPACLHANQELLADKTKVITTGWFGNENYDMGNDLMSLIFEVTSFDTCNSSYRSLPPHVIPHGIQNNSQICAGSRDSKEGCQYNSGSPLQIHSSSVYCMYEIVGIASFGQNCAKVIENPGVYTRVSHYIGWIEEVVWGK